MNVRIAPSMLAADFSRLREHVAQVEQGGADWLHLDVMDGMFVPNISFGPPVISSMRAHTAIPFDTHLMIRQPERYLEDYRKAGADMITVHHEACDHLPATIARIKELGAKAGVAINPATPVSVLTDILESVDLVLVMSVNPGFGGQAFMPGTFGKIEAVKTAVASLEHPPLIEVDGGIDERNAGECVKAGANVLVAGTSVFRTDDPAEAVRQLRQRAIGSTSDEERV